MFKEVMLIKNIFLLPNSPNAKVILCIKNAFNIFPKNQASSVDYANINTKKAKEACLMEL